MFNLTGKVAFITGASRGFGQAIATTLAAAGADLGLFARTEEGLLETAKFVKNHGRRVLTCVGDVMHPDDVSAAIQKTVEQFGKLDILINNAGIIVRHPIEELTDEDWFKVMNTNLSGPFFCTRAAVPYMKQQKWGRIINVSSMMGLVALPERVTYSTSKTGIIGMTKSLALELAQYNITVNAIAPGPFLTELNQQAKGNPVVNQFYMERTPLKRWGDSGEVGSLVLYLASEESAFMTGTVIPIDGGWTAQ
ncbi:MAG TPA: 2-deoxy-D-gluconate 3-dehydrogenase [Firmicutes bacterium]|jgi:NAD(P)-dependent dehydrogenase (short-subunit alcohol dehydrogenase family)|nr:2-deoxy-D-gluconate 3-dehydrogenase [Bacillota bacterium]